MHIGRDRAFARPHRDADGHGACPLVGARLAGSDALDVRTVTFPTLVITNLALIFTNRSLTRTFADAWFAPNRSMWILIAGALLLLGLVVAVPGLRDLFQLARPHSVDVLAWIAAGIAAVFWMDTIKLVDVRIHASRAK